MLPSPLSLVFKDILFKNRQFNPHVLLCDQKWPVAFQTTIPISWSPVTHLLRCNISATFCYDSTSFPGTYL